MRYSLVSVTSTQRTGTTSNKDLPQRKKSTLRGALSRLFGRKKKGGSQGSSSRTSAFGGSSQHRSVRSTLCSVYSTMPCKDMA
jgi:hypothetical protein